jgi:hypothetical protein
LSAFQTATIQSIYHLNLRLPWANLFALILACHKSADILLEIRLPVSAYLLIYAGINYHTNKLHYKNLQDISFSLQICTFTFSVIIKYHNIMDKKLIVYKDRMWW